MTAGIARSILAARYLRDGESSFTDVCRRVAAALGRNDQEAATFFGEMHSLRFLPNSPTLMNAGTELGQLAACFTLHVGDSIPEIFDALKWGALIHQSGGGTGYNFSAIRPKASPVRLSEGVASGPVSFMRIFNEATEVIRQGGRRRGANIGILNVGHPDILEFICSKQTEGELANFNISVMADDTFMRWITEGRTNEVWLTHPCTGDEVTAGAIWEALVDGIWTNGEPGVLFSGEINRHNPTPRLGPIEATNPCGEQPLLPFESCVLGSVNLARFVEDGKVDAAAFRRTITIAVRFLDRIIDVNRYPIPAIEEATHQTRKIGLGVMGVHDALLMLGLPYDTEEARELCRSLMETLTRTAVATSHELARETGPFPAWKGSIWEPRTVRNAALTSIAPTGSISLLAGCSGGIEPLYSFAYTRRRTVDATFEMLHPLFARELDTTVRSLCPTAGEADRRIQEVIRHVRATGTIQDIAWLPASFRRLYRAALDIGWEDHIKMQAAFQEHVHASISKTINMPETATREDVAAAVILAWECRLKGVTIYRTGSRQDVVLALGEEEEKQPWPGVCCRPPELRAG
ncbi:MAG TPA: adenosylcobalamin-dependent ribonucleoside-diphosphate reductase [Methanoculleus sp.]|nr:adenosylcobalamin-dependent ribonucleoside-diphosphate reductase [Methanoculleus sp.]